jgi:L-iditol 2-dehydrogenase
MKAAFLVSARKIVIEEISMPQVKEDEVLVRIKSVGICGSDVHYFKEGRIGDQIIKGKFILGHEASGEVVDTGKKVKKFKGGERVFIEPGISCGRCEFCIRGKPNLCPSVKFLGTPPVMGAMAEYVVMPESNLIEIPKELTYDEGILAEPLAIGIYGVSLSGLIVGDEVAILGAGPIGLSVLFACKSGGASKILVTELIKERARAAEILGADAVFLADKTDATNEILKGTGLRGVDVSYECAGKPETCNQAIATSRIGGKAVIFGIPAEDKICLDPHLMRKKELTLYNVRRSAFTTKISLDLMAKKQIDFSSIITHRFPLGKYEDALTMVSEYREGVIKAVVNL